MTLSNSLTDTAATAKDLARALSTAALALLRFIIVVSVLFYVLGASCRQFVDGLGATRSTPIAAEVLVLPGVMPLLALPPATSLVASSEEECHPDTGNPGGEKTSAPTVKDAPDYDSWNVKQLRAEAKARKIKGYGNLSKNQLIAQLAA